MPRTILVVDNNAFYRQVLSDFFKSEGYEVAVAGDGVEALERITEGGVDFILLDLIMPRIDGGRLCRFLKSHPSYAHIPVIILSGILADEIEGFESIKADAYVAKMPMDQLQVMLRSVLQKLQTGSSAPLLEGFEKMYRREVVLELLEERRAREVILNSITEGIVELTANRRILRTNHVFERMVGMTASGLLSMPIGDLFEDSPVVIESLFETAGSGRGHLASGVVVRGGRSLRLRLHTLDEDGCCESTLNPTIHRVSLENPKVRLVVEPKSLPGYVLLIEDVSEQLRTGAERDRFRERLTRSERMSSLGIFAGGAAHELNNPLTAVMGYAQLLQTKSLPADVKASLKKIEAGAERCKAVVENLLLFSRNGAQDRRPTSLSELVRQAAAECEERAAANGVELAVNLEDDIPEAAVNRGEVTQALLAILDNAVRAAGATGGKGRVDVRTSMDGREVVIEIADNGPGIPAPILSRIFDPFFGTRAVGDGMGLGLSVAYGIIRGHSGVLSARNVPGSGACLAIRIPALRAASAAPTPAVSACAPDAKTKPGGRILIVDDEPVVVELLTDVLGGAHEIETAENGRDGLTRAWRGDLDLIILDIKMPDMSGRQMYEALRAERPDMAERIIFTTGDSMQPETRVFLESIRNPCITKPFSLDTVSEIVDRMMSAARTS